MEIEDITGVSLSAWRSSQQEGHLSVSDGLLGEIVIDDESVFAVVSEVLSNSASGVGGQELKRSGFRGGGGNDASVVHGTEVLEGLDDVGDCGSLLADGNVDAVESLGQVALGESLLLVNDSVDGNCSFSSLSITNNQFSLTSSNRHKSVD